MKITKQRLREIIKEELSTVRENDGTGHPTWDTEAPDSPFSDYNLEAENEKAKIADIKSAAEEAGLNLEEYPSLWEKITAAIAAGTKTVLDAVEDADIFPGAEQ